MFAKYVWRILGLRFKTRAVKVRQGGGGVFEFLNYSLDTKSNSTMTTVVCNNIIIIYRFLCTVLVQYLRFCKFFSGIYILPIFLS